MGHGCRSGPQRLRILVVPFLLLALASMPRTAPAIEVQDSPAYGVLLNDALSDLREPVVASARWSADQLGRAADFVFGTPAWAQTNQTIVGERTLCSNGVQSYTQCDGNTGDKQKCKKTVQSQSKTQCNGPSDKSVCKDGGTRCPGDGNQNQCPTNLPAQFTHCTDNQKATLCLGEATQCQPADGQKCKTTQGANKTQCAAQDQTTYCKAGSNKATLCRSEATGCSSKGKNICKTTKTNDKTSCQSSGAITQCRDAGTTCTGDDLDEGCEFFAVATNPTSGRGGSLSSLVVVDMPPGYFTNPLQANLIFNPPGPVLSEPATLFDDQQALFYVNFPPKSEDEFNGFQMMVTNGILPQEVPGLVVGLNQVPAANTAAIVALVLILSAGGAMVIMRRRTREETA